MDCKYYNIHYDSILLLHRSMLSRTCMQKLEHTQSVSVPFLYSPDISFLGGTWVLQSDLDMYTSLTTTTPCLMDQCDQQTWRHFNFGIDNLKKMELELINLELEFPTKRFNPQINLPFNFRNISSITILFGI